ncbi:MAG: hypothetical protein C4324_07655 [Blastocatellia bacterium]
MNLVRALALVFVLAAAAFSQADLVIVNANVVTMNKSAPRAEAIAAAGDRIIAVGTTEEIIRLAGSSTRIIDARSRLVLPGFNDSHVHLVSIGNIFSSVDLSRARSAADVAATIANYAATLPKGRWILGSRLPAQVELNLMEIDRLTPDNPLFVYRSDAASAFANSRAAAAAGLKPGSSRPFTGDVIGDDLSRIRSAVPIDHTRDWPAIIETASNYAARFGITSVQDTHSDSIAATAADLNTKGRLKIRLYDCVALSEWARLAVHGLRAAEGDAMVRTGCVKGFYDEDDEGFEVLTSNILGADKAGLQVLIHSIGPKAIAATLEAFKQAAAANGARDRRFRVEHAHLAAKQDLKRMAAPGIILSMQPYLFFEPGKGISDELRTLLDFGARIAFGSDAAIADIDPLAGIYAAVNAGKGKSLTIEEAVYAYTLGAAYAEFQESEKGSIEPGKLADFVILSDDIFRMPPSRIREASVVLTIMGGRITYISQTAKAENFKNKGVEK